MKHRKGIESAIANSYRRSLRERKEYTLWNKIPVQILQPFAHQDIDMTEIISSVEKKLPYVLSNTIEAIYVGDFEETNSRHLNAIFKDGAIYIDKDAPRQEEVVKDVIHEIGHSIEELFSGLVYEDDFVEREFLGKRMRLQQSLKSEGYPAPLRYFANPDYDRKFDFYLYDDLGYATLLPLTMGLFVTPYSVTSLREYFAESFLEYFTGNKKYLAEISPVLYNKIEKVMEELEDG
tara:strand:+ start:5258 stop:5962 length:705 start_codon:yes stop_codon:yes gene_type:complete